MAGFQAAVQRPVLCAGLTRLGVGCIDRRRQKEFRTNGKIFTEIEMRTTMMAKRGRQLLNDPILNRGTGYSAAERHQFGLHGLLPERVESEWYKTAPPRPLTSNATSFSWHCRTRTRHCFFMRS